MTRWLLSIGLLIVIGLNLFTIYLLWGIQP